MQGAGLDLGAYEGGLGGARIVASVEGGGTLEPLGVTLYPDLPAPSTRMPRAPTTAATV
ncbi:MAG: hypothetical protein WC328_09785 [Kiritimatiellia bacterium]|nr:hypothetical protein [Kiritimatiellia bacterium]NLC83111.1 hypothetical protein [Lentisphaerota bacterium]